ncbi:dephospho-CoA kinase [Candidatus Woesearchaeota archaeon]|nr:dephospho-CoA kinase [Candidatus Woesearchaeota archaeon]
MIIGITGSIGSGKTTVAKLFSRHHYSRIDADEISHGLMGKNSVIYKKLIIAFGNEILDANKNIDRRRLSNIVFNDDKKLKKLNSVMHQIIIKNIKNEISKIKKKCVGNAKIIIDAPLLLETKAKNLADTVIVVKCDKKNVIKRLSRIYAREKIEKILNAQMPLREKLKHADFVVDNNKDLKRLEKQVVKIIRSLEGNE